MPAPKHAGRTKKGSDMQNAQKLKKSGNQSPLPGWQKSRHRRHEHMLEFVPLIRRLIDEAGGVAQFAKSIGKETRTVEGWLSFKHLPKVETICKVAEVYEADLSKLLEASGRPPIAGLRHLMAKDADQTLPTMLREFRDRHAPGDTARAAKLVGISRSSYSRYVAGSARPGTKCIALLAARLGVPEAKIAEACAYGAYDKVSGNVDRRSRPSARYVQEIVSGSLGLDPLDTSDVRRAARRVRLTEDHMRQLLRGAATLSVEDCMRIATRTRKPVATALTASGIPCREAKELARALNNPAPARAGLPVTCGDLLHSYRITKDLSLPEIARRAGFSDYRRVLVYERGRIPDPVTLVRLTKALGAPLSRFVRPAGLIPA